MATESNEDANPDMSAGQPPAEGEFYWRQSRENLLSPAGIRLFQLAYGHKDQEYQQARLEIDKEYEILSPRLSQRGGAKKHGGIFATYMSLLQEMGLMHIDSSSGQEILRATPAGDQAYLLLTKLPDFLKAVPYFVAELLSRYRFNNPLNTAPKNPGFLAQIQGSDIFPYWSVYKVMRSCDDYITKDELARFLFKAKHMSELPQVIKSIREFRLDQKKGVDQADLDSKYGAPLSGAIGQSKYIMGRAGFQTGLIVQEGDTFKLNPEYLPFIDQLLSSEPNFEELDEQSWVRQYGSPIELVDKTNAAHAEKKTSELSDDDKVLQQTKELLDDEYPGVILVGPPGTGKSYYARQIAIKLAGGDTGRIRQIQFHPSYQYEDFVEAYVPDPELGFVMKSRILLQLTEIAEKDPDASYVMVIDELNRTDPARVFGEVMTYMEKTLRGEKFFLPSGKEVSIPPNLLFLGTMNPEDRSVDELDAAMDRRWAKVYLDPDADVLASFLTKNGVSGKLKGAVLEFFKWVQRYYPLGHAFFRTVKGPDSLQRLYDHQLVQLFEKKFRFAPDVLAEIKVSAKTMLERSRVAEEPKLATATAEASIPQAPSSQMEAAIEPPAPQASSDSISAPQVTLESNTGPTG